MQLRAWSQTEVVEDDISSDINDLIRERGKTCISMILPVHHLGQDRQGDEAEIRRAVSEVKQKLPEESMELLKAIDDLVQQIDFIHNEEGLGLFVSPSIRKLIKFPFPVVKKIAVDKFFYLEDLLFVENYSFGYMLLEISKKEIHLFQGFRDHLEEIREGIFPKFIREEYEYNKPSQGSSYGGYSHVKGFEKDKSILRQIRLKNEFEQADRALSKYLSGTHTPLLLCGPKKDISIYNTITNYPDNIVKALNENGQANSIHDLEIIAWKEIKSYVAQEKLKLINEFKEKIGEGLGVYGPEHVWNAAIEGRGLQLLVEKDWQQRGFITINNKLYLNRPGEEHIEYRDVISQIIYTVLEKNGKVTIVQKDSLKDFDRIALINRY